MPPGTEGVRKKCMERRDGRVSGSGSVLGDVLKKCTETGSGSGRGSVFGGVLKQCTETGSGSVREVY